MDISNLSMADLRYFERKYGVHLGYDEKVVILTQQALMNFDAQISAQPGLVSTPSGGIPWYLSNYMDPKIIEVIFAPNKGKDIMGEAKKGDWTTNTATFMLTENTGEVSSYGDYSENGSAGVNVNFPQRQSYHYQTISQYGEKQQETYALAKVDYATKINESSIVTLNKFQNQTYFFGLAPLQLYGLINEPSLPAALTPGVKAYNSGSGPWITSGTVTATANEMFADVQALFLSLQSASQGVIQSDTPMVLALSPESHGALLSWNAPYNSITAKALLQATFPNLRFEQAVQYKTANNGLSGNLMQLIATEVNGDNGKQQTGTMAFTEKLRAHRIIPGMSSFKQKKSQGTWGFVLFIPFAIAQMLGI